MRRGDIARFGEDETDLVFGRQPLRLRVQVRDDVLGKILRLGRIVERFGLRQMLRRTAAAQKATPPGCEPRRGLASLGQ